MSAENFPITSALPSTVVARKNAHGNWQCTTDFTLADGFHLSVMTGKRYGGALVTNATVHKEDGNFHVHRMYTDYSHCMASARPARITARVVESQHMEALKDINTQLQCVKAHYQVLESRESGAPISVPV